MTDNVTSELLLENMKAVRSELHELREAIGELTHRQIATQNAVLSLRRDQLTDAQEAAHLVGQFDKLKLDVARIKRRLDISD